nr:metallophosphoesterase family protein [Candidatus Sigynarchaeota archaeon]
MNIDYGWRGPGDFRRWGPYLSFGNSAATEMRVSWQSKFHSMTQWIQYGETKDCPLRCDEDVFPTCMHSFSLTSLKPNTRYYYRISRPEDLQVEPQPVYSFMTGPPDGSPVPFEFSIAGDIHASGGNARALFTSIRTNAPKAHFVVTAGDCVDHGGHEERWNEFFWELVPFSSEFILMNATGNHDTDHAETYAHFINTFHHPYVNPKKGAYYHFIYGNAVFIVLDSTNAGQTAATQGVVSDEQMEWLEKVLNLYALKDYWIFLFMHHPMYTTGDTGMMDIYELAYRDLFDNHHVDGVFFGHDHHFEVFWVGKDQPWGGTHYCLVGNGGGNLGLFNMDPKLQPKPPNYLWKGRTYIYERDGLLGGNVEKGIRNDAIVTSSHVYGIMEYGFTHFVINGDQCEMRMWGLQNQLYFHDAFNRTGHGKSFHKPLHRQEF